MHLERPSPRARYLSTIKPADNARNFPFQYMSEIAGDVFTSTGLVPVGDEHLADRGEGNERPLATVSEGGILLESGDTQSRRESAADDKAGSHNSQDFMKKSER